MAISAAITTPHLPTINAGATLEPVRFGEFLRDRHLISDEQWLAALAAHWSSPKRRRIGDVIVQLGALSIEIVEAEARAFHDELDVVELDIGDESHLPRSEKTTLPGLRVPAHQALA